MAATNLHVYHHYKSIWREVDHNKVHRLAVNPDLQLKINEREQGHTPLFLACLRKNYEMVSFLLEMGADANIECKQMTPLYLACLYAETTIVDRLLLYGADPNVLCTTRKIAPIHLAASKGTLDILNLLIENGADVNLASPRYGSSVHIAVSKNHQNVLQRLISSGAALNTVNAEGDTPLHIASRAGLNATVRILLEKSANPTFKDKEGNTSLHMACYHNHETTALILLANCPDLIYMRNNTDRQTPTFYATESIRKAIKNAFSVRRTGFVHALNNKMFSDFRFFVDGKTLFGHKIILIHRCPSLPLHQKEMTVPDMEFPVFFAFLKYLYTDSLDCDRNLLPKLVYCAERFQIRRLKKLCQDITATHHVDVPESTFSSEMKKAIGSSSFSDVTFLVDKKPFPCHKIILIEHAYFRAMFSQSLKESSQKEITMEVKEEAFGALLQFIYTGELLDTPPDDLLDLFYLSDQFMIDGLRHSCETALGGAITMETVSQLFALADSHKSIFLKEECVDFIIKYYYNLSTTEEYNQLTPQLKEEIQTYIHQKKNLQSKPKEPIIPPKDKNFSLL